MFTRWTEKEGEKLKFLSLSAETEIAKTGKQAEDEGLNKKDEFFLLFPSRWARH